MKSKTKIDEQAKRKRNPEVVETIMKAKKSKKWLNIAHILSSPRSNKICVNLDKIERETKEGDTVIVPGKVLAKGDISKKIRVVALSFSEEAKEKLENIKGEIRTILEEMKLNPNAQGVKIIV